MHRLFIGNRDLSLSVVLTQHSRSASARVCVVQCVIKCYDVGTDGCAHVASRTLMMGNALFDLLFLASRLGICTANRSKKRQHWLGCFWAKTANCASNACGSMDLHKQYKSAGCRACVRCGVVVILINSFTFSSIDRCVPGVCEAVFAAVTSGNGHNVRVCSATCVMCPGRLACQCVC